MDAFTNCPFAYFPHRFKQAMPLCLVAPSLRIPMPPCLLALLPFQTFSSLPIVPLCPFVALSKCIVSTWQLPCMPPYPHAPFPPCHCCQMPQYRSVLLTLSLYSHFRPFTPVDLFPCTNMAFYPCVPGPLGTGTRCADASIAPLRHCTIAPFNRCAGVLGPV